MPKSLVLIVLSSLLALPMMAQDDPKIEVFGGYQYLHAGNIDGFGDSANSNGWNVSATVNFSQHLGVAADFSGNYKTETMQNFPFLEHFHAYTYTFGPVASWKASDKIKLFTHALFGGAHSFPTRCDLGGDLSQCSGDLSVKGFAMMLGGGVDARIDKHFGFRVLQADWVYLPVQAGGHAENVRLSTGLLFRF
jgi:hypothetical protein